MNVVKYKIEDWGIATFAESDKKKGVMEQNRAFVFKGAAPKDPVAYMKERMKISMKDEVVDNLEFEEYKGP